MTSFAFSLLVVMVVLVCSLLVTAVNLDSSFLMLVLSRLLSSFFVVAVCLVCPLFIINVGLASVVVGDGVKVFPLVVKNGEVGAVI